jgi:hypothetical protein
MLVGTNELVDPAARKEGQPAFSADSLPINKLTCPLFHYCALTQLVEVCFRVEAFSACLPAGSSVNAPSVPPRQGAEGGTLRQDGVPDHAPVAAQSKVRTSVVGDCDGVGTRWMSQSCLLVNPFLPALSPSVTVLSVTRQSFFPLFPLARPSPRARRCPTIPEPASRAELAVECSSKERSTRQR